MTTENDAQQTFITHLIELRDRLMRIIIGIVVVFVALFNWSGDIYHLLALPMLQALPKGGQMVATEVTTPFFVPMKVTMMAAFLISLPNTLYQVWAFIAPGLYDHEKKLAIPLVMASMILFMLGMAFAYFFVFPVIFGFMTKVAPMGVAVMTDIGNYLDFVLGMFLAFGVTFEVPIAVILLVRFGVVSIAQLKEARSYVIVGAFVIAAVVTPPDVLSQIMLAVPLWLLFEAGVIVAAWISKSQPSETESRE